MKTHTRCALVAAAAIIGIIAGESRSSTQFWYYPQVDQSTHWQVGNWDYGILYNNARKLIKTDASTTVSKYVFHSIWLTAIAVNYTYYQNYTRASEGTTTYSTYTRYYGYYDIPSTNYRLYLSLDFYKDGEYRFQAQWTTSGGKVIPPLAGTAVELRVDHGLGTGDYVSQDDIIEFNDQSAVPRRWAAPAQDFQNYFQNQNPVDADAIEYEPLFRVTDVPIGGDASGRNTLSLVYWPMPGRNVNVFFMNILNEQGTSPPTSSYTYPLQEVFDQGLYEPYAHRNLGDNLVYFTMAPFTSGTPHYGVHGKLFQRGNGRSLKLYRYTMTGAEVPSLTTVIDPDNNRTASNAFTELGLWQDAGSKTGLANPYGTEITPAELHAFLQTARQASPSIYTTDNRTSFQDYFLEFATVPCWFDKDASGGPNGDEQSIMGLMFDGPPFGDGNQIHREAAVAFWWTMQYLYSNHRSEILAFAMTHEIGHCLNLCHNWGSCGANYYPWSNPACTGHQSLMTYSFVQYTGAAPPYTHVGHTSVHWYGSGQHGGESYADSELRFYQRGPESWVKPGKMGQEFVNWIYENNPPDYCDYGAYCP